MNQADLIADFVGRPTWAVVGVSANPTKFGRRIYQDLRRAGYRVYAVNPHETEILGDRVYPNLAALPERPDVIDLVVPPSVSEMIVKEAAAAGIRRVWMQPGAESQRAIDFCRASGIEVVAHACAMVEKRIWNDPQ
ncbi:CoA-binding protein [Candidatus Amarolinea aalborgensis]|uniref:CoA-binding protein n=1 Tax=Candidatus Amarolinea aalborgensis TaxID=2249329 RepID=UPI003BF9FCE6